MSILEIAKEKFGNVFFIVSAYSMSVVWASEEFHNILGYGKGELINLSIRDLVKIDPSVLTKFIVNILEVKGYGIHEFYRKDKSTVELKMKRKTLLYDKEPHIIITEMEVLK